jgi:hypothetical protein
MVGHHPTICCSLVRHRADSWERDQKPRQRVPLNFRHCHGFTHVSIFCAGVWFLLLNAANKSSGGAGQHSDAAVMAFVVEGEVKRDETVGVPLTIFSYFPGGSASSLAAGAGRVALLILLGTSDSGG